MIRRTATGKAKNGMTCSQFHRQLWAIDGYFLPPRTGIESVKGLLVKRCKPHDVLIEAMADLFDRYNASSLADELRTSRDSVRA